MAAFAIPHATATEPLIDRFIPHPDVYERHEVLVHAPADAVFELAQRYDLRSNPLVRFTFWLRGKVMGAARPERVHPRGLVPETLAFGWGVLARRPGRELVMGAATQPWKADVDFKALPADRFAAFSEPDLVKIVWTLETEPLGPALTRLRTETRVKATTEDARRKFRRYWWAVRFGIVLIRHLLLRGIRRAAENPAVGSS